MLPSLINAKGPPGPRVHFRRKIGSPGTWSSAKVADNFRGNAFFGKNYNLIIFHQIYMYIFFLSVDYTSFFTLFFFSPKQTIKKFYMKNIKILQFRRKIFENIFCFMKNHPKFRGLDRKHGADISGFFPNYQTQ